MTYGITVSELGEDKVHEFQGKEPSGRKQSAIALDVNSKLEWQEPWVLSLLLQSVTKLKLG